MKLRTTAASAFLFAVLLSAEFGLAQATPPANPERDRAFELYKQGKMVDAMPLLEQLSANDPKDVAILEAWGVAMLSYSQTLSDPELRKKARLRSRSILVKALDLGDTSDLPKTLLGMLPEDGSVAPFSQKKEVNDAMQQAEADFARGDIDKAREGYMRAHLLDPQQYFAALFIGDTYFRQQQSVYAGEWFSQAIQIDPNRETAYRYWGDALLGVGRKDEARSKYIDAIIADPYNQASWIGVTKWAKNAQVQLSWLKLKDGVAVELKDGKTNVTVDSSLPQDATAAWLMYGMSRSLWMTETFHKTFPKEPTYRRSLAEETDCLNMLIEALTNVTSAGKKKRKKQAVEPELDAGLQMLIKINQAGLLKPFVLLNRADDGIAKDYEGYRAANRDKIRRYLDEFVVPQTPPPSASTQN